MKINKINSISLIFFCLFILSLSFVNATTDSINVSATDDTYTYNASADTNYGNAINLYVRTNITPEIQDTYLEYIINDIPDEQEIDYAGLCIYADLINDGGKNVSIYLLSENFVENILKWKHNYRQYILYNYNVSYEFNSSNVDKYTCVDITDLVDYAYSQDEVFLDVVIIGNKTNNGTIRFSSKEGSYPTFLIVDYSDDYSNFCQYNAFKDSTISTCNNFVVDHHCQELFDEEGRVESWVTSTDEEYDIPPFIPHTISNADEPFYFDRIEVWAQANNTNRAPKEFDISVYSPETDTWYLLIDESDLSAKDGAIIDNEFGGGDIGNSGMVMVPYLKNIDTIYLGNLLISKVQVKVYDTFETIGYDNLIFNELAFCVMSENESVINVTTYEGAGLGVGCDTNADCECQLCEYGFCVLRKTNMNCVINGTSRNDCCLSGTCSGGKCTKESLWEGLDASKNQMFGNDVMTNNFISLFFIIAIAGFLMYYGNIIAGVFSLYMLSIFFVIVGWLSSFILIGMILTGLIALVFKVMMGQGSE